MPYRSSPPISLQFGQSRNGATMLNCKHEKLIREPQGTFCANCGIGVSGPALVDEQNATAVESEKREGYGPPSRHITPLGMPIPIRDHAGGKVAPVYNRLSRTEYWVNRPKSFSSKAYHRDMMAISSEFNLPTMVSEEALKLIDTWSQNEKDVRFDKTVRILAALVLASRKQGVSMLINGYCKRNLIPRHQVWRAVKRIRYSCHIYEIDTLPDFVNCLAYLVKRLNVNDAVRNTAMDVLAKYQAGNNKGDNPWVIAGACVAVGIRQQMLSRTYPLTVLADITGVSSRSISLSARILTKRFNIVIPTSVEKVPLMTPSLDELNAGQSE